ncbi:MAG TPA: ROK family protein [Solirubrobacterales bacterium]|nr:ROK family protein [Solirubrobacterales bacterium]
MSETIGVDVGGTKVSVARFAGGELDDPVIRPTETADAEQLIEELVAAIGEVRTADTDAVGMGVPSVVDFATGTLRSSVNVPFENLPLRQILGERLGLPVFVDNDATVAALAEASDGERIAVENLVMFTVGTGVGGGLVLGGRIYRGATGAAAEIGHTLIGLDLTGGAPEPPAGFPKPGSLESLAAGTELDRLAVAMAQAQPDSALGRLVAGGRRVDGRDAVEAAQQGDEAAIAAVATLGERLGVGIASAINLLDPEVVAIGGGASAAGELLLAPARRVAERYVLNGVGTRTEVRLARRGPEAGVLGAALLAATEGA